ncbi:hypothetical protein [Hyphomicrobium sp.]|uniref:hypothetical protein n=1 Tax=Hyphomicrobium sp. TaxID=82 RepID=UPI002FE378CD
MMKKLLLVSTLTALPVVIGTAARIIPKVREKLRQKSLIVGIINVRCLNGSGAPARNLRPSEKALQ